MKGNERGEMGRYQLVVLTRAREGQRDEFERWYDEQHLADVAKVPGVVSARRFRVLTQESEELDAPAWCSLAIYELATEDPQRVRAAIRRLAGTAAMPLSEALNRNGMVQLLVEPA